MLMSRLDSNDCHVTVVTKLILLLPGYIVWARAVGTLYFRSNFVNLMTFDTFKRLVKKNISHLGSQVDLSIFNRLQNYNVYLCII